MRKILLVSVVAVIALLLLTAASPSPASAVGPAYYVVRPGDTLAGIAWRYGTTSWALARLNGIWDPNRIYAGQVLRVGYAPYPPYPPYPYPYPSYRCMVRVNYGDTMIAISRRLGMDAWTLARANGIYNLNWIYAGQWLRIPGCVL